MRKQYTNGEKLERHYSQLAYWRGMLAKAQAQIAWREKRIKELLPLPTDEYSGQDWTESVSSQVKEAFKQKNKKAKGA